MVDDMYPDNLPPEIGIPACIIIMGFYFFDVIKERRAEVKARMELRKASQ